MDRLIRTSRDVSILEEAGILRIGLNSHEEVAYFFHRLCMNVYYNNGKNYLRNVYNNVNSYCDLRSHRWKALMLREYSVYFKHSWKLVSVVAATILLDSFEKQMKIGIPKLRHSPVLMLGLLGADLVLDLRPSHGPKPFRPK
ncbi:hypothetical protein QJS10_CPB22g01287 [Acorus calamus]|uniref:Uncharacterized protein n=1 Tax=Acorus calamus TaxID=4465 RepID=A0AAV9BZ14_ACOCL|nr:hypothetical protein QJS10_CPB22g01287 [Acorus calamus]